MSISLAPCDQAALAFGRIRSFDALKVAKSAAEVAETAAITAQCAAYVAFLVNIQSQENMLVEKEKKTAKKSKLKASSSEWYPAYQFYR